MYSFYYFILPFLFDFSIFDIFYLSFILEERVISGGEVSQKGREEKNGWGFFFFFGRESLSRKKSEKDISKGFWKENYEGRHHLIFF